LKYSRGYKAGGFNTGTILAQPVTNPEFVNAYEGGIKEQLHRTVQANVALFYYDYYNMQTPLYEQPAEGPIILNIYNIPKVVSWGVELETIWQATPDLQFMFNYAYLNATVRQAGLYANTALAPYPATPLQPVVGNTIPQSPRNKLALNANYTFHMEPGDLTFSASYIWKEQTYDSIFNTPAYLAPAYSQVDARVSYTDTKNRYTIIAYVQNLTNALGYDNVSAGYLAQPAPGAASYYQTIGLIPPRTYGVELQVRFP
jgi:iron complex outermembrane receptor protein